MRQTRDKLLLGMGMALFLGTGYFAGRYQAKFTSSQDDSAILVQKERQEAEESEVHAEESRPIAVVNLDTGVECADGLRNYGMIFLDSANQNVEITGLKDARKGIENGTYSAYLVIPDGFSENVESISEEPVRSCINYSISMTLSQQQRENVIYAVADIYNNISNDLSEVYMASILQNLHAAQDEAQGIMERDQQDLDTLLNINGYDLVEMVQVPELQRVESQVEKADLSSDNETVTNNLENIADAYETSLQMGTEALSELKGRGELTETDRRTLIQEKQDLDRTVQSLNTEELEQGTLSKQLESIIGEDGTLEVEDAVIKEFNQAIRNADVKGNYLARQYREMLAKLEYLEPVKSERYELCYDETLEDSMIQVQDETFSLYSANDVAESIEDAMEMAVNNASNSKMNKVVNDNIQAVVQQAQVAVDENSRELKLKMASYLQGIDTQLIAAGGTSMLNGVGTGWDVDDDTKIGYINQLIGASKEDEGPEITVPEVTIEPVDITDVKVTLPEPTEVTITVLADATDAENTVGAELDGRSYALIPDLNVEKIKNQLNRLCEDAEEQINNDRKDAGTLKQEYNEYVQANMSADISYNELADEIIEFDFLEYIDEDGIMSYKQAIDSSNQSILAKMEEQNASYDAYVDYVYQNAEQNIDLLKQSIDENQTISQAKLELGLESAKESKQNSLNTNQQVLENFVSYLTFTRLGKIENIQVYEYIAEPLKLENRSEEPIIIATAEAEVEEKNITAKKKQEKDEVLRGFIVAAPVLVLFIIAGTLIYGRKKEQHTEEF